MLNNIVNQQAYFKLFLTQVFLNNVIKMLKIPGVLGKTKMFQMTWVVEKVTYGFILMPSKLTVLPGQGVSSSGGLERCFSTLGTLRTSMGVKKADKLAFMYRQMNKK